MWETATYTTTIWDSHFNFLLAFPAKEGYFVPTTKNIEISETRLGSNYTIITYIS